VVMGGHGWSWVVMGGHGWSWVVMGGHGWDRVRGVDKMPWLLRFFIRIAPKRTKEEATSSRIP